MDSIGGVMIMYSNAQYQTDIYGKQAGIRVDINGVTSFVPLDEANADFQRIMALVAEGKLTIGAAQ
jgi:hypothetical protein